MSPLMTSAKTLVLSPKAKEHLAFFSKSNPRIATKITRLLREVVATPFSGTGKPEALKHEYSGYWSRRIDGEHRLVYRVEDDAIIILSCRFHY
jgi:toxin YoeB